MHEITTTLNRHLEVHFVIPVFYIGIWNGALSLMVLFIHDPSIGMHLQEIPVVQWIWFSLVSAFAVTGIMRRELNFLTFF